ncbi:MAG: SDR family oxidoreductase [bacterium]|nr:SDR family oxidoreductase [bacterium]
MSEQFENKVALITGGGNGIGRASARAFSKQGAKIVIADINIEGGEHTVHLIQESGGDAIFVNTDITQAAAVEAMVAKTVEAYGRLDCAFNNAGIADAEGKGLAECSEEAWDTTININLKGVWLCMKYEILHMLNHGGGAIVNTASILGLVGIAGATPYVVSKHGVVGLTKTGALQYAQQNIRVNAICPGFTRTNMIQSILDNPEREAKVTARHPMGRLGTPEEIAEAAVWLCSDAASFVTGHAFPVDGGYIAQ